MKIVLATGGSGGHIHPALAVAGELRRRGHEVIFIGSLGLVRDKIQNLGFQVYDLNLCGFSTKSARDVIQFFTLLQRAYGQARAFLKKIKPDVVCGFGGYGALPAVLSALGLRYPTMIHEQNVAPGKANAVLARWVNRVAISFEQSKKFFPVKKTILTGCPTHLQKSSYDRKELLKRFNLRENTFTILVTGGSQGSYSINQAFLETIPMLPSTIDFQVIHLTGKKDFDEVKKNYVKAHFPYAAFSFLEGMDQAYALADLVVARSGAVTVTEIAHFGVPAILIPYPHAQGHQKENALVLCEAGLGRMIEEKDLTPQKLKEEILSLIASHPNKNQVSKNLQSVFFPEATGRLTSAILDLSS